MALERLEHKREIQRRSERKRIASEKAAGCTHGRYVLSRRAITALDQLRTSLGVSNRTKAINHMLERLSADPALQKEFGLVSK
jgi:hypothetical protein